MIAQRTRRPRGATLVEFVVIFPIAVLLVLGLIQTGFIYMAKSTLNHAVFMAARVGATHNADRGAIMEALVRGLSPFHQDASKTNDSARLALALAKSQADRLAFVDLDVLSPTADTFTDFGVRDPVKRITYIPNDNLEFRSQSVGARSKVNLRDANLLKIRVTYGYQMKVPVIAGVIRRVMCGGATGVSAWGDVSLVESEIGLTQPMLCARYYAFDRIPLRAYALVEMQSPAIQK